MIDSIDFLTPLYGIIWFTWVSMLAIVAVFIIGAFMILIFGAIPDKICECIDKKASKRR